MAKGGLNGFLSNFKSSSGEKLGKEEPKDKIPPKSNVSQPDKEVAKASPPRTSAKEVKSSPKPVKLKLNVHVSSKAEEIKKPDTLDDDLFNIIDAVKEENKEIVENRKYARANKQVKAQAKFATAPESAPPAKVSTKPAKASSADDAGTLVPETIDRLFKASETPHEHRDKWIDAYVKANKSPKNNAMSRKVREGRFRFKEKDGLLEILPEFSSYKMDDREILRGNWLGDQTKKKNKENK